MVTADPKAIAARRQDGQRLPQKIAVKESVERSDPAKWRREHKLPPMKEEK